MYEFIDRRQSSCLAVSHFCEHVGDLIAVDVGYKVFFFVERPVLGNLSGFLRQL